MKYKVVYTQDARDDLRQIHAYIMERFGKKVAAKFLASFRDISKALGHTPRMYEALPDISGVHKCAALSPTLVIYEVFEKEKRVEILALYDGRYPHG